jgi:hypothetical protein
MHNKIDWEEPQKQVYLRYGGDGIADLIVGGAFLGIGLMMASDMPFVPVWIVILLAPISWALKRLITVPRLSQEEITAEIEREGLSLRAIKWAAISGVLILSAMVLLTATAQGRLSMVLGPYAFWVLISLTLVSIFVIVGLIFSARRWAVYALLVMPLMLVGAVMGLDFPLLLAALGTVTFLGGLFVAARFVLSHPRLV